jgi:hypothetical protein
MASQSHRICVADSSFPKHLLQEGLSVNPICPICKSDTGTHYQLQQLSIRLRCRSISKAVSEGKDESGFVPLGAIDLRAGIVQSV